MTDSRESTRLKVIQITPSWTSKAFIEIETDEKTRETEMDFRYRGARSTCGLSRYDPIRDLLSYAENSVGFPGEENVDAIVIAAPWQKDENKNLLLPFIKGWPSDIKQFTGNIKNQDPNIIIVPVDIGPSAAHGVSWLLKETDSEPFWLVEFENLDKAKAFYFIKKPGIRMNLIGSSSKPSHVSRRFHISMVHSIDLHGDKQKSGAEKMEELVMALAQYGPFAKAIYVRGNIAEECLSDQILGEVSQVIKYGCAHIMLEAKRSPNSQEEALRGAALLYYDIFNIDTWY